MSEPTRILDRRDPAPTHNCRTQPLRPERSAEVPPPCELAFLEHWAGIRSLCTQHAGPGMAVFAIDERGIASTAVLAANPHAIRTAIAGRHSGCDLSLPLRFARRDAVRAAPLGPGEEVELGRGLAWVKFEAVH